MMHHHGPSIAVALCFASLLGGCSPRSLIFSTYSTIGLDITATDAKPTKAVLGYKRFEGAIIPVDPEMMDETTDANGVTTKVPREAMSVYAAIDMENSWLKGIDVFQVFATGDAAVNAVKHPEAIDDLLRKVHAAAPAGGTPAPAGATTQPAADAAADKEDK